VSLLAGVDIGASGTAHGPAARAGRALRDLGARTHKLPAGGERLTIQGRSLTLRGQRSVAAPARIAEEYLGLLMAGELLAGRRTVARARANGLTDGAPDAPAALIACRDGWLVARWRDETEPSLLEALVGPVKNADTAVAWRAAMEARLIVSPVRATPRVASPSASVLAPPRERRSGSRGLRVIDWTNLWAGPWATGELARDGVEVLRIEAPGRRDGYLRSRSGRRRWQRWNGSKRLIVRDARHPSGRRELREVIAGADILVTAHTPRVLPHLGFDDDWFATQAPHLFHLSLVAYEEPFTGLPGMGEQACALAGLFWRGQSRTPARPYPWADPLLGAWALLVLRAHAAAGNPRGGHLRLSLESAAARAITSIQEED
jgi:hypothetical protein